MRYLSYDCPYCGEKNEAALDDPLPRRSEFSQDCGVCCRPARIEVRVGRDGDIDDVDVTPELEDWAEEDGEE